ncbi:hypothetical protein [Ornithinimicrobium kibberense]|uniref:hypothetical protein n=1 Tax=Ornithinimicrobium kibberense TaxID=282060 RepID=UPI00361B7FF8
MVVDVADPCRQVDGLVEAAGDQQQGAQPQQEQSQVQAAGVHLRDGEPVQVGPVVVHVVVVVLGPGVLTGLGLHVVGLSPAPGPRRTSPAPAASGAGPARPARGRRPGGVACGPGRSRPRSGRGRRARARAGPRSPGR